MHDAPKESVNLTPAELAERWRGTHTTGSLSNMRVAGTGPRFFRPSGKRHGKVLYRLVDVEAWERENLS